MSNKINFCATEDVRALGVSGAYLVIRGLSNCDGDESFEELKNERIMNILENLSDTAIDSYPVLQGFRDLHQRIGKGSKKNMASPENLLRSLLRNGSLPHVNLLVDIYNLVSVGSQLALGAHDLDGIVGNVTLKLTEGTESFWPLGYGKSKQVGRGEYAYVDDQNDVICWLEVRQVEKTKVSLSTKDAFYIIQGNTATDSQTIQVAVDELVLLTKKFCGGQEELLFAPWMR